MRIAFGCEGALVRRAAARVAGAVALLLILHGEGPTRFRPVRACLEGVAAKALLEGMPTDAEAWCQLVERLAQDMEPWTHPAVPLSNAFFEAGAFAPAYHPEAAAMLLVALGRMRAEGAASLPCVLDGDALQLELNAAHQAAKAYRDNYRRYWTQEVRQRIGMRAFEGWGECHTALLLLRPADVNQGLLQTLDQAQHALAALPPLWREGEAYAVAEGLLAALRTDLDRADVQRLSRCLDVWQGLGADEVQAANQFMALSPHVVENRFLALGQAGDAESLPYWNTLALRAIQALAASSRKTALEAMHAWRLHREQ